MTKLLIIEKINKTYLNLTIGIFDKINLGDKKMKKSSIAKLVLFTIFLTTFLFGSTAYGFLITINKDKTYNLIMPPIPYDGVKRVVIRIDNQDNQQDRKFYGRSGNPDEKIVLESFKFSVNYFLTITYYTEQNDPVLGDAGLVFHATIKPNTDNQYNFNYIILIGLSDLTKSTNSNSKSKKFPI